MEENKNNYYNEEEINIKEIIYEYLRYWKWFIISVVICVILGIFYLKITPKQYKSEAKILLNNESKGGTSIPMLKELATIADLSDSKIEDQIEILKSRRLMSKVIDKLDLNVKYYNKILLNSNSIYKEKSPVYIRFTDTKSKYSIDSTYTLEVEVKTKDQYVCTDIKTDKEIKGYFGKIVKFPFGDIIIFRNPIAKLDEKVIITISPIEDVVSNYIERIDIKSVSKNGNTVNISLQSSLPEESNKIIDLLIQQYREDIIEDRNKVGNSTISFINDRLSLIFKDLESVDSNMEGFKVQNKLTDVVSETQLAAQQSSKIEEQLKENNIQLSLIDYVGDFIRVNERSLLPANIGLKDPSIIQMTQQYNQLVLERDNLLNSSTEENPMVINLDGRIREFNRNLQISLQTYKRTTEIAIRDIRGQLNQIAGDISKLPAKERGFRDIARRQQTVEAIYLLLLQKREETEITTASTPNIVKIVDNAYFSNIPTAPKKTIILLTSLILGFIIPFGFLYIKFLLSDKIKYRKDVEKVIKDIPMIGDIPKSKESILVESSGINSSSEAFRILRTNINFMLANRGSLAKSIYLTSTISGEGKTYIAINLAITLATASKKVLVIEADIRKPKVREYIGIKGKSTKGISEYLAGVTSDIAGSIIKIPEYNIDLLPSGMLAPNPAELLMSGRFKNIMAYGLENYDYVIVDTAPVSAVTDTLLINDYANLMLYVVRANYLDKRLLEIPKRLYEENKLKNVSILLNDVDKNAEYGYSYGYYIDKPWYKRLFKTKD